MTDAITPPKTRSPVRVEAVDPRACVDEAAAVLRAAWPVPRLRYAPEDLAWRFARPGWAEPRSWLARDGDGRAVGFGAALPRTVALAGRPHEAWLTSFYAAVPGDAGVALALLRGEIRALKSTARPSVVFAAPGSAGEAMLRAYDATGYGRNALAVARVHGGVAAAGPAGLTAGEAAAADGPALAELVGRDLGDGAVADHLDPATLAHDLADPLGRCWAVVRGADGASVAAACTSVTASETADGPTRLATLSAVTLPPEGGGEALAALAAFAARRWADRVTSPVVAIPNPSGVPPAALRAARMRALPAAWAPYLFCPDPSDPLLTARITTLEVV